MKTIAGLPERLTDVQSAVAPAATMTKLAIEHVFHPDVVLDVIHHTYPGRY